jgi:hypothetical protein
MKHLLKKISLIGAGGRPSAPPAPPPPPPARLEPPKIGKYNPHSSYSHAEIIDLISDGPIEAIVSPEGKSLANSEIFQGIYLDDAPIAQDNFTQTDTSEVFKDYNTGLQVLRDLASYLNKNVKMDRASGFLSELWNWYYEIRRDSKNEWNSYLFSGPGGMWSDLKKGRLNDFAPFNVNLNSIITVVFHQHNKMVRDYADAYYKGKPTNYWESIQIVHEIPNLEGWSRINTDFTPASINQTAAGPSTLHYYKKGNVEMHFLGTQGLVGTMFDSLAELESIKNNTSINKYERQIIADKIAEIKRIYRSDWSGMGAQHTNDGKPKWLDGNSPRILIPITAKCDRSSFVSIGLQTGANASAVKDNELIDFSFYLKGMKNLPVDNFKDFIIPEINASNQFTGRVYGFIYINIPISNDYNSHHLTNVEPYNTNLGAYLHMSRFIVGSAIIQDLKNITAIGFTTKTIQNNIVKYNYNNILSEIKYGTGDQKPLAFFSKLYLDKAYKQKLIGPFRTIGQVRRFNEIANLLNPDSKTSPSLVGGNLSLLPGTNAEGSLDSGRISAKGSYTELNQTFNEDGIAFVHIVENPEAVSAIVSITINELTDTLTKALDIDGTTPNTDGSNPNLEAPGTKIPATVSIRIEVGKQKGTDVFIDATYDFSIYGIISSASTIDFGNPSNDITKYNFISTPASQLINKPFALSKLSSDEINSEVKRYIRVYKISTETHSVLLRRELYVDKITEIVDSKFSYPFCAIVGSKIDARSLSSVPVRSFDCRLKKIKLPSNYFIMEDGYDVRYQKKASDYKSKKRIYRGDWNGKFKVGWTDNPAWILYDILTNKRYGLGGYIDESQINVWELYKIARYCDAVDNEGYFLGVTDGRGGLEPRFSCNVLFTSSTKLFDAINIIANLFRGSVYFSRSEVSFCDDRPKEPMALFNNSNVKDGLFNYITYKKDEIFNTVEVAYLDRHDNFKTKIELVEDFEDIRQRGPLKTVINTIGVTSKAMARRIGRHAVWQTTKENQAVEFTAGLESLLCKPGDLIIIDDELKTRNINCGRILDIDVTNQALVLSNLYDNINFDGYIELYTPIGAPTRSELDQKAQLPRTRIDFFTVKRSSNATINLITGLYGFSSYDENNNAIYSGYNSDLKQKTYCYYDNTKQGWIFSTGFLNKGESLYDKVICYTNSNSVDSVDDHPKYSFVETSTIDNIVGQVLLNAEMIDPLLLGNKTVGGIYDDEILTYSPRQITKYQISGATTNINDGSIVYLHPNNFNLNLLSTVEVGSSYRVGIKSNLNQIYKVISIREENQNEYLVVATKYDSGKWSAIENDVVIENPQQIFYDSTNLNRRVKSLDAPTNLFLDIINEDADSFDITGSFDSSHNLFKITLENKAVGYIFEQTTPLKQFGIKGLNDLGRYDLTVQAISNNASSLDSYPSKTQKFIGYDNKDQVLFDRPYIETFTIL